MRRSLTEPHSERRIRKSGPDLQCCPHVTLDRERHEQRARQRTGNGSEGLTEAEPHCGRIPSQILAGRTSCFNQRLASRGRRRIRLCWTVSGHSPLTAVSQTGRTARTRAKGLDIERILTCRYGFCRIGWLDSAALAGQIALVYGSVSHSGTSAVSWTPHGGRSTHHLHAFCIAPAHARVAVLGDKGPRPAGGICGMPMPSL